VAALGEGCADLIDALRSRDPARVYELLPQVAAAARQADADEVQDALARLTRVLADVSYGIGGDFVQVTGALADRAPDPSALLPTLVYRVTEIMEDAAQFAGLWGEALGDPPDPEDLNQIMSVFTRFKPVAARSGTDEREARKLVEAWFAGSAWVQTLLYLMQRKDVQVALPSRAKRQRPVSESPAWAPRWPSDARIARMGSSPGANAWTSGSSDWTSSSSGPLAAFVTFVFLFER
jgi:hypothetical protein